MRQTHTKQIQGKTYVCQQIAPLKAFVFLNSFAGAFGPELAPLLSGVDLSDLENEAKELLSDLDFSGLLGRLAVLPDDFLLQKVLTLFECVWELDTTQEPPLRAAKPLAEVFDQSFEQTGGIRDALLVAVWAFEVNFREFFGSGPSKPGNT